MIIIAVSLSENICCMLHWVCPAVWSLHQATLTKMWHLPRHPISILRNANVVLPFVLSHIRTEDVACCLTTGLHSSRGLLSDVSLLSKSKEPELVPDRFYYMFHSDKSTKINQSITLSLSSLYHLHWRWGLHRSERVSMQKSLCYFTS